MKTDYTAVAGLFGISFLYGVFHAAGPGHGKAVISSYLFANNETWRRGVVLSCASAMLQALVAILLVGIASIGMPPPKSGEASFGPGIRPPTRDALRARSISCTRKAAATGCAAFSRTCP